jgi:hypothetical protein
METKTVSAEATRAATSLIGSSTNRNGGTSLLLAQSARIEKGAQFRVVSHGLHKKPLMPREAGAGAVGKGRLCQQSRGQELQLV